MRSRLGQVAAAVLALLAVPPAGCGEDRPASSTAATTTEPQPPPAPPAPAEEERAPSCDDRSDAAAAALSSAVGGSHPCRWNGDCVFGPAGTACSGTCPSVVARARLADIEAAVERANAEHCQGFEADGCAFATPDCPPLTPVCSDGTCSAGPEGAQGRPYPPGNDPRLTEAPPRPPPGDADEKAVRLFDAIVHDDPARAADFFFPRDAFLVLKGIANAGGYWDRLYARYEQDIHELHRTTPDLDRAELERLEIVRRGGWVGVREEGNRLPYWASRHSWLHYRVDGQERRIEVRVLITWDEHWYITHLSEFH